MPYDPEKSHYKMQAPTNLQEAVLMNVALGQSVMTLLDLAAEANGNRPGPWLDELEARLIRDAKGSITEGVPIQTEAQGMGLGVEMVAAFVNRLRRRLEKLQREQ